MSDGSSSTLRIDRITKRYGDHVAVSDLSFEIESGCIYGLLGPNGSGKTTTLACALGLLNATEGEIRVLGLPADRIHQTNGRVAALFDEATLVPGLSVRQNLKYAQRLLGHEGGREIDETLELVGIGDLSGHAAGALSMGQARRVS